MTKPAPLPQLVKRRGARWALVPVALLASSLFGVGGMALVAVRDPNFALEPDYYQKAIHWDQVQAQAANNQRSGFQVLAPAVIVLDKQGRATLKLEIKSQSGHAVTGAHVIATGFPNAYSEDISPLQFSEQTPGVYLAPIQARHVGLWEFRVALDSGADHVTAVVRCDLTPGGAA
jgi:FixH protein